MKVLNITMYLVLIVLLWLGNASTSAFNVYDYSYLDKIDHMLLFKQMLSIEVQSFSYKEYQLCNTIMVGSSILFPVLVRLNYKYGKAISYVSLGVLCMPYGYMGVVSLIGWGVFDGFIHDGEWIGEGWPMFEAFFFGVCFLHFTYRNIKA